MVNDTTVSTGLFGSGVSPVTGTPEGKLSALAPDIRAGADRVDPLVRARLGIAAGLFSALRAKHAPSAFHSLRVALGCSSWAIARGMEQSQRDALEIAALLHDIGKIGVPDALLEKPTSLGVDEFWTMNEHRQHAGDILHACCATPEIVDIVRYAHVWFHGDFDNPKLARGTDIPVGARMLAIVDAFDSMTTNHVYRRAMSRERAIAELFACADHQFDRALVEGFADLVADDRGELDETVAQHWLNQLCPEQSLDCWKIGRVRHFSAESGVDTLFHAKLLENMHDGVIFIDSSGRILHWNRAAERLTGITGDSVCHKRWEPSLIELRDEEGNEVREADCPVRYALDSRMQSVRRYFIQGRTKSRFVVNAHVMPVTRADSAALGATLVLHDASSEMSLEERVQNLHERATKDPLTGVANRAEFDRFLEMFVDTHLESGLPCCLIICDIDRFKLVNDVHGHQAGDEALISFAQLLQRSCRQGDLVARYGGEEFVMLCADCGNRTAAAKADEIRSELSKTPQSMLDGRGITASFGVTELQRGDTPETMLRRADRGLLQAKDTGRNRVVELGAGLSDEESGGGGRRWLAWLRGTQPDLLLDRHLLARVPLNMAVENVRGFVADQHGEIGAVDGETVVIAIDGQGSTLMRRSSDRTIGILIELTLKSEILDHPQNGGDLSVTRVHVRMRPKRNRDRRGGVDRATQLYLSLKSYLVATEVPQGHAKRAPYDRSAGK